MNMEKEFENVRSFLAAGNLAIKAAAESDDLQKSVSENFGDLSYVMSFIPETLVLRAYIMKAIIVAGYFASSAQSLTEEEIAIRDILRKISNRLIKEEKKIRELERHALNEAIKAFDALQ